MDDPEPDQRREFTTAEMGMLAHLYRGELYRSTVWRTRLDTTTNWSVVTLGVALSLSFSSPNASPLPLVLVGVLIVFFLLLEARRYRYFNVWRARCRWMELHMVAPLLETGNLSLNTGWQKILAEDYRHPSYHVSLWVALGRRIRRNYLSILLIQTLAYIGKIIVHPSGLDRPGEFLERAAIGPIPGWLILTLGAIYCAVFIMASVLSMRHDRRRTGLRGSGSAMG